MLRRRFFITLAEIANKEAESLAKKIIEPAVKKHPKTLPTKITDMCKENWTAEETIQETSKTNTMKP